MDTKLKNRHRISALLSVLIVVAAAVIMTGLYPFFEKEAGRHEEPVYEDQAFLRHLVFGNYVLDLEQSQYENGVVISPFEQFFPEGAYELKTDLWTDSGRRHLRHRKGRISWRIWIGRKVRRQRRRTAGHRG